MRSRISIAARWAVGPVALALAVAAGCERPVERAAPEPTDVVVARPVVRDETDYEEFTGHTDAILSVEIKSRVTGYLNSRSFVDGAEVKEGDLLCEVDPRPYRMTLTRAEATLARDQAHLDRLKLDYARANTLLERGAIGRQEYDLVAGNLAESEATVGVSRAQRDLAQQDLDFTRITAPMAGQISEILVDPGNLVVQDRTIITDIVAADKLYVYFDLDEAAINRLRDLVHSNQIRDQVGAQAPILVGLSDNDRYDYKGQIDFTENKLDAATGTLRLRATIDNPRPWVLSPGLFVRIRMPIGQPHPTLLLADDAVGTRQGQRFVYVVDRGDEVSERNVDVGPMYNGLRAIRAGLSADDRVILNGLQRVRPGIKVTPRGADAGPARKA